MPFGTVYGIYFKIYFNLQISAKPEDRRNRTELYNPMTITEL